MAYHNRVELLGHLGADPKVIEKDGKIFISLSIATTDSYPIETDGETKWKDKETVWHSAIIFRPTTAHYSRELKKGDRVRVSGEIAYRPFKDQEGFTRQQANIIVTFIEKVIYEKQENFLPDLD